MSQAQQQFIDALKAHRDSEIARKPQGWQAWVESINRIIADYEAGKVVSHAVTR